MIKTRLLLIEEEEKIRKILRLYLRNKNFDITEADSGESGMRMFLSVKPEIVITELSLPDIDGKEVIRNIREFSEVPIIICSNRAHDSEVISALDHGADDFVPKPFNPEILMARIRSGLRRSALNNTATTHEFLVNGPIKIDLLKHEVSINEQPIFFPPKQYNLLKYLLTHKGKVLLHREILEEIWGKAHVSENQYLRVQIGNIREKIKSLLGIQKVIHAEPGIGYRMEILPT